MMKLEQVKNRAKASNKVALEVKKEKDDAEKEVEELKRQLQPKRARTHDDGDDHEMHVEVDNWNLSVHRREATRVQNRRNVALGSLQYQPKPRTGKDGFWRHVRLGHVGWIAYWCNGDSPLVVDQISWYQTVHVLSRPLGQKTSSQSQHQQGLGITRKG